MWTQNSSYKITAARSTSWIKILTIRWAHSQSIIDAMDYKTLQQALITMLVLKMWTILLLFQHLGHNSQMPIFEDHKPSVPPPRKCAKRLKPVRIRQVTICGLSGIE